MPPFIETLKKPLGENSANIVQETGAALRHDNNDKITPGNLA